MQAPGAGYTLSHYQQQHLGVTSLSDLLFPRLRIVLENRRLGGFEGWGDLLQRRHHRRPSSAQDNNLR